MFSHRLFNISHIDLYFKLITFILTDSCRFSPSSISCPVQFEKLASIRYDTVVVVDIEIVS